MSIPDHHQILVHFKRSLFSADTANRDVLIYVPLSCAFGTYFLTMASACSMISLV